MDQHASDVMAYLEKYRAKCRVLKQIHSDLGEKNRKFDLWVTVGGIVLTAAFTFAGFTGTPKLIEAFGPNPTTSVSDSKEAVPPTQISASAPTVAQTIDTEARLRARVEVGFNLLVLLIFVSSLLTVIYRWKERSNSHLQGVTRLTQFVGWLDELKLLNSSEIDIDKIKSIRTQYQSIVELLPPNNDKDYKRALEALDQKEAKKLGRGKEGDKSPSPPVGPSSAKLGSQPQETDVASIDRSFVVELVAKSPSLMPVLQVLSSQSSNLWLSGGSIRNYVWDWVTGKSTPVHDFDIAYFDCSNLAPERDTEIEKEIKQHLPLTFKISVKNQARMHLVNNEPARASLEDAISHFPETATALAARISPSGQLEILTPHGVGDLMNLIVRPTPYHLEHPAAFERRANAKNWETGWPGVKIERKCAGAP